MASLFGPIDTIDNNQKNGGSSGKKKASKKQQQQQRAPKRHPRNARAVSVDLDGVPLHYKVKTPSNNNNYSNNKRGRNSSSSGSNNYSSNHRTPFSLPTISNPKRCLVPWWTPQQSTAWETEQQEQALVVSAPSPPSSSSRPPHYLFGSNHNAHHHHHKKKHLSHNTRRLQLWLSQLDAELEHFQHYVQVSAEECAARDFAVSVVQHVSQHNLEGPPASAQVRVQVFGSYATPSVCAFCSDVDMALFGVVPVPASDDDDSDGDNGPQGTHTRFGNNNNNNKTNNTNRPSNNGKNSRIQKWRDVLEECFADAEAGDEEDNEEEDDDDNDDDDDDDDVPEEVKNGDTTVTEDTKNVASMGWQSALDQLLEGSNEGPDSLGIPPSHSQDHVDSTTVSTSRKRALSATSISSTATADAAFYNDLTQSTSATTTPCDQVADAENDNVNLKPAAHDSSPANNNSQFANADDDGDNLNLQPAARDFSAVTIESSSAPAPAAQSTTDRFFVVDRVGATEEKTVVPSQMTAIVSASSNNTSSSSSSGMSSKTAVATTNETKQQNTTIVEAAVVSKKRALSMNSEMSHNNHSGSDSEDDTADKLASLMARKRQSPTANTAKKSNHKSAVLSRREPEQFVICLSSDEASEHDNHDDGSDDSTAAEEEKKDAEGWDDLHVSFVSTPAPPSSTSSKDKASFGPQGVTRVKVVKALRSLGNILRRREFTQGIQVISRARVPIVKFETRLGFEGDVAMGGHNGTDTSQFARSCVERYKRYVVESESFWMLAEADAMTNCMLTLRLLPGTHLVLPR